MSKQKSEKLYDMEVGSQLFTVKEAAKYLKYHEFSIYRLARLGQLQTYRRTGRTRLFLREELERFKQSHASARKSSDEVSTNVPKSLPSRLTATVTVDVGFGFLGHPEEEISNFTWGDVPLIHARIKAKYNRPLPVEIHIESPDGGQWYVRFDPPTWFEGLIQKVKERFKG